MILQMFFVFGLIVHALTLQTLDGDNVNCVDKMKQPAFKNILLRNHKLQERPSKFPKTMEIEKKGKWNTWQSHVTTVHCPEGTVPVREDHIIYGNYTSDTRHEYAVGSTDTTEKVYGAQATVSVWEPAIEKREEFSLSQIWITSGGYETNDLNTIEVGWQVFPNMYRDYKPRLFIFWTSDTYTTGCYNLKCPGFIQTSSTIVIGGAITPVSAVRGNQFELKITVWKDQKLGNWWLSLGPSLLGYWPAELFGSLANHADAVAWGGEIVNLNGSGRHTATHMGSGHFPSEGFGKSSYFRDLKIVDDDNWLKTVQNINATETNPEFYKIKSFFRDDFWGTCSFYGGPGYSSSHSGVPSLVFSSLLFYFSFVIFFII